MVSKFLVLNNDPSIAEKRGKQAKTRRPAEFSFSGSVQQRDRRRA